MFVWCGYLHSNRAGATLVENNNRETIGAMFTSSSRASPPPARILVVDDDSLTRTIIGELLDVPDIKVLMANSGDQALKQLQAPPYPDIILLDVMMPGMDGFAVLKEIKKNPATAEIPVIFLTSLDEPNSQEMALRAGAVDYLSKPIVAAVLDARLRVQLSLKQARDALAAQKDSLAHEVAIQVHENTRLEQRLKLALDGARIGIWEMNLETGQHHWNDTLCQLLGTDESPESLPEWLNRIHPEDRPLMQRAMEPDLGGRVEFPPFRMRHHDGEWLWLEGRGHTVFFPENNERLLIGTLSDISERKESADRIHFLSNYDPLTHLPNRRLFSDRLQQKALSAERFDRRMGLIVFNINRFRMINDAVGAEAGDRILIEIAQRLSSLASGGDTVGRLSGNEFGFILDNLEHERELIALVQKILALMALPIESEEQNITVSCSMGISIAPRDGHTVSELLRAADTALGQARQSGHNSFCFYSPQMNADAARRLGLEAALGKALEQHEFSVHYQPQISLDSGRLIGMEALLRWHNPVFGSVSPAEFIPVAEEAGLIVPIGEWVLRTACRQTKQWRDLGFGQLHCAVNLSARQFRQPNLLQVIEETLKETGLPSEALELEITETAFIDDVEEAIRVCRAIKRLGVKLSLDDFGTGYSSLAYVSRFPFDKIKIDQSFVHDIVENPVNAAIATAAIVMARSLNLTILAEGVETQAQASFLRGRRCDAVQGYLFSRPLSTTDFTQLLAEKKHFPVDNPSPNTAQPTLLLVDDEPNILSALRRLFHREGYRILEATTPAEAFEHLARNTVQVILCDQRLGPMTGSEVLARVKQLYPNTVRMMLTGYIEVDAITEAINRGAVFRVLSKPWEDDELREQVRSAFRIAFELSPPQTH